MVDALITWGPLVAFVLVWVVVSRRQMRSYGSHVDEVRHINVEIAERAKLNHALLQEQLEVLKQIKTLLEDRKS